MAASEDPALLQRRARRRLVGAIALALLVVIVLPIVFDQEPRPITQDLVIEIPRQDSSKFNPRLLPQPPAPDVSKADPPKADAPPPEPAAKAEPAPVARAEPAPAVKTEPAPTPKPPADPQRAEAILQGQPIPGEKPTLGEKPKQGEKPAQVEKPMQGPKAAAEAYVVPLGLFSKPDNAKRVQASVTAAGFKAFSETIRGDKGELLRVRAGPYPTREAAEQAREKLKAKGVNVGAVVLREQP